MQSHNGSYYTRGSREYWKASVALLFAGYANFSVLNFVQPLMPEFSRAFDISPSLSSLSLSVTSATMAIAILIAAFISGQVNRHRMMVMSLIISSLMTLPIIWLEDWNNILVLRAITGLALGGVPAIAMAYLAEEIHPDGLGLSMGLYVSGTALGGMAGRFITGIITYYFSWRFALGAIAILSLLSAVACLILLPPSRNFVPQTRFNWNHHCSALKNHLLPSSGLLGLFVIAFTTMGGFVIVYNYLAYRLLDKPFYMSQGAVALIFIFYVLGMIASPMAGAAVGKWGSRSILKASLLLMMSGVILTIPDSLVSISMGIALITFGFFSSHGVASGWVGRLAKKNKSHASALYLLAYYGGASLLGSLGGHVWILGYWGGLAVMVLALLMIAFIAAQQTTEFNKPPLK